DKKGNSFVTGYFTGIATFDSIKVTSIGQNVFFAKYDSNGNCLWVKQAGGTQGAIGYSIANDENGNIYSTGWFQGNATFGSIQLYGSTYIAKISDNPSTNVFNESNKLPNRFNLAQNYPNPFNPSTVISYSIPAASNIKLVVYNTLGQTVRTLEKEYKSAGNYSINFNAVNIPSGIYFYKLDAGQFSQVKKMIIIK
ncbi:MAG: T9SS type A sorting domain-containing protein, partial [Ignavibacteriaceae bacterium]|nr:T9SS type A sorting domain-containing protein [Ignavibacteriaceae bacterium]